MDLATIAGRIAAEDELQSMLSSFMTEFVMQLQDVDVQPDQWQDFAENYREAATQPRDDQYVCWKGHVSDEPSEYGSCPAHPEAIGGPCGEMMTTFKEAKEERRTPGTVWHSYWPF